MPLKSETKQPGAVVNDTNKGRYIIACASGEIYKVKRPGGSLATEHLVLMTKAMPVDVQYEPTRVQKHDEEGNPLWKMNPDGSFVVDEDGDPVPQLMTVQVPKLSEGDIDRMSEAFRVWAPMMLPKIIEDGLDYDDMPGEDQYGIFVALFNRMNLNGEVFRFTDVDELRRQREGIPETGETPVNDTESSI